MRETFTTLRTSFHDYTQTTTNDETAVTDFRDRELNNVQTMIAGELALWTSTVIRQTTSVADQQYYHYPTDIVVPLKSVTVVRGDQRYILDFINSPQKWNGLNAIQFDALALPRYAYPRARDFGIYPIPQDDDDTIELEFNFYVKDMSQADYATGTITATNNSTAITGSGTTFASWMAGAWIKLPDGLWYRIASQASATSITLETYYEGTTTAGATYNIGESPELPPELHELIPHYAAMKWFLGPKKDPAGAAIHSNMFWTGDPNMSSRDPAKAPGGILAAKQRYSTRDDSAIVYTGRRNRGGDPNFIWGSDFS